jgi:squalene-associated FAD-dependent desaturase
MRATRHAHIVGAGLAGLAAAVTFAARGWRVTVHEAGPAAGGRCRSYFDRELGCRIDNGNHLLLSGNGATMAYLAEIGAAGSLTGPDRPLFPFVDVGTGARWTVAPNAGPLPWWVLRRDRRVPGTRARDYLALLALRRARADATVAEVLGGAGALYRCLLAPLAVAALNTPVEEGSARLLGRVVAETLMRGGAACLPRVPRIGLSESFVDPAIAFLAAHGGVVQTGRRVTALALAQDSVTALHFADGPVDVTGATVVLAVPPPVAVDLLTELAVPSAFCPIVNVHFRAGADPGPTGFCGVVGGTAEWVFVKPGIVSVTVSAAQHLVDLPAETIAARIWPDVCAALGRSEAMPPVRVVKERRATIAATAAEDARRPGPRTRWRNLTLAGDWTATGLPATIEGAVRSGRAAAELLLAS